MRCGVAMLMLAIVSLSAQAADLYQIYRMAQTKDPTFEAARYGFAAAQQKIPQARAGLLPVVNLNGNGTQNSASSDFTNMPTVNRDVHSWAWTL